MARPSKFTDQVIEDICERLSLGEPLAAICRDEGMPAYRTVKDWQDEDGERGKAVSAAIARAREAGEEWLAAECLEIADNPLLGVTEKMEPVVIPNPDDPDGPDVTEFRLVERKTEDMLGHRKLQIDTRLKLLAKFNPKRWGDRQTVEHQGRIGLEALVAGAGEDP